MTAKKTASCCKGKKRGRERGERIYDSGYCAAQV